MRRRITQFDIVKSDEGQALTEFAIIISLVVLLFLLLLQYSVIARTGQLCSYAAFAAARCYAVHAAVDGAGGAQGMATNAACWALAPVAQFAPGEILGLSLNTGALQQYAGQFYGLVGSDVVQDIAGYYSAKVRFSGVGGGGIGFSAGGTPPQIHVEIDYPQPVFMPGLVGLWSVTGGERGIHRDLEPLLGKIGGYPAGAEQVASFVEEGQDILVAQNGKYTLDTDVLPYIDMVGKCTLGVESWGAISQYRPRQPADSQSAASSAPDPSSEQWAQGLQGSLGAATNANNAVQQANQNYINAEKKAQQDQQVVDQDQAALNSATTTQQEQQAKAKLDQDQAQLQTDQKYADQQQQAYQQAQSNAQSQQGQFSSSIPTSPTPP